MADATFFSVLPQLFEHEGGYVNHPRDPGGATNMGVTQAVYDAWQDSHGEGRKSVKLIRRDEAAAIYRQRYWNVIRGDDLPAGVDYAVLDAAVNSGPKRGAKWLQQALGLAADGTIGPASVAAARNAADKVALVKGICRRRLGFVHGLTTWKVFGKGWARRIAAVEALSVKIAFAAGGRSAPSIEARAAEEAGAAQKTANRDTAVASGTGAAGTGVGTQVDLSQADQLANWLLAGTVVAAAVIVAVLIWRAHVNRQRAAAYTAVAQGE